MFRAWISWLALSIIASAAHAATIHVARDGSGDFTVVPEAVAAAASGDTVRIAAGVYPEVLPFETPGGIKEYVAEIEIDELTIIGEGRDVVILGPEAPAANLENGPGGLVSSQSGNFRVRGVTVRNVHAGVWGNDAWLEVEDCRFVGNFYGVAATLTGPAMVRRCEFVDNEDRGVFVFGVRGGSGAIVEDSTFADNPAGVDFQPTNCILRRCSFAGGAVGAQVSFGGSAEVRDCTFTGMISAGFGLLGGSQGYVYDCVFEANMPWNIFASGLLVGTGNELKGGTTASLTFPYASVIDFRGNHILNGGGWSVRADNGGSFPIRTHDMSDNYWGTTDTAQIDEWIYDSNDISVGNYLVVDYLPIAELPIPAETTSFGGLKSRFGRQ